MTDLTAIHSSQHIGECDAAYTGLIVAGNSGILVKVIRQSPIPTGLALTSEARVDPDRLSGDVRDCRSRW